MTKAVRWTVLLSMLAGATTLVLLPEENDAGAALAPLKIAAGRAGASRAPATGSSASMATIQEKAVEPDLAMRDPFAPRGWLASSAPVVPVAPPPAAPAPAPVVQEPVGPPPLPYKFMGKMDDGGSQVLYLSRGNDTFVVHAGDTLENAYKVLTVDARRIEFEHIPTSTRQVLDIPVSQ